MKIKSLLLIFSLVFSVTTVCAETKKELLLKNLSNLSEVMSNIAVQLESQSLNQDTSNEQISTLVTDLASVTVDLAAVLITSGSNAENITINEDAISDNDTDIGTQKAKINAIISAAGVSLDAIAALPTIP